MSNFKINDNIEMRDFIIQDIGGNEHTILSVVSGKDYKQKEEKYIESKTYSFLCDAQEACMKAYNLSHIEDYELKYKKFDPNEDRDYFYIIFRDDVPQEELEEEPDIEDEISQYVIIKFYSDFNLDEKSIREVIENIGYEYKRHSMIHAPKLG